MRPVASFLILFPFFSISIQLGTGQVSPCQGLNIPGLDLLARGVHATRLDWTIKVKKNIGIGVEIFEFTCVENRQWMPQQDNGTVYSLPDQVKQVRRLNSTQVKVNSFIGKRSVLFVEQRCGNMRIGLNEFPFTESESIQKIDGQLYPLNVYVAETSQLFPVLQLQLKSPKQLKLSSVFLNLLPVGEVIPTYVENPTLYDKLVNSVGTHYVEFAIFGGHRYLRTSIAEEYLKEKGESFVVANLKANFTREFNHSNETVSPDFLANSQLLAMATLGGADNLTGREWSESLFLHPWLLSAHLRPITDLISNEKVRKQVDLAIAFKTLRAYLKELKRVIKLGSLNLSRVDQKTLAKAEGRLQTRDAQMLIALGRDLVAIWSRIEAYRDPINGKVTLIKILVWVVVAILGVALFGLVSMDKIKARP